LFRDPLVSLEQLALPEDRDPRDRRETLELLERTEHLDLL
jgi:hypothetical protein